MMQTNLSSSEKVFFLLENNQHIGPFSIDQLKEKQISKSDLVWIEGMSQWRAAGEFDNLQELFKVSPPPPPSSSKSPVPPPFVEPKSSTPPPFIERQSQVPPYKKQSSPQNVRPEYIPKAGGAWIVFGIIFALLGGYLGIAIGVHLKYGKEKLPNGEKVTKFDDKSQQYGLIITIVAVLSAILWMSVGA